MSWFDSPEVREERKSRKEAEAIAWKQRCAQYQAEHAAEPYPLTLEEKAAKEQQQADFRLGLKIGLGVLAGVGLAHAINGAASAPAGWALAQWANQNGVQL